MKLASGARHLEVQLLADEMGNCVSLFGRDCSIQRKNQKIIEEIPSDFVKINNLEHIESNIIDLLLKNKVKYEELKNLLVGELSWNKLVNGLFFRLTSVSDIEIDELISKNPQVSIERAKNLVIQRQLDLKSSKMLRDMFNEATIEYK